MAEILDLGKVTGSVMRNTSGVPAAGTGLVTDWAIDAGTGSIYEKTSDTVWTLRGNMKGPAGLTGAAGATGGKGDIGPTGPTGPAGTRGSRISQGTAMTGTATANTAFPASGITDALINDLYLNTGTGNLYRCTVGGAAAVARWVYTGCIKGATGATGATGGQGPVGGPGQAGAKGEDGKTPTLTINAAGHLIATYV